MEKTQRQAKVTKLIKELNIANQEQLQTWLSKRGVTATQASLSRDLNEIGAVKVGGYYRLPAITPGQSRIVSRLNAERAGEHMIVLKTDPLHAPVLAALMDRSKIPGLLGTIAGDDTVFAAVASGKDQTRIIKRIVELVRTFK